MPQEPAANPRDNAQLGRAPAPVEGPPEEEFWDMYNKRMEFPTSWVVVVFLHVLAAVVIVYLFKSGMDPNEDKSDTPLKLVAVGGLDDDGAGRSGSGGTDDPIFQDNTQSASDKTIIPTLDRLNEAKANIKTIVTNDPTSNIPISAHNAAAYQQLNDSV